MDLCPFKIYHTTFIITILWWFCRGCSPLPIPNREVKPLMADGTALKCGRVGSCHIYLKKPPSNERLFYFVTCKQYGWLKQKEITFNKGLNRWLSVL